MTACRHFGICGGCAVQDMPRDAYRAYKRGLVVDALAKHGLRDAVVEEIVAVAPGTRRRATFKAVKRDGAVVVGFHGARSHSVIDMLECRVLTPGLFGLVAKLRMLLARVLPEGGQADIEATETETGFDLAFKGLRRAEIARWAQTADVARAVIGKDILAAFGTPTVTLGRAKVALPSGAFLQPTRDGESMLQDRVRTGIGNAKRVADLFSGCGTFSFVAAETTRVHAVERDAAMLEALAAAARMTPGLKPITAEARDLFKQPLMPPELKAYDAVMLDPPRAGAAAQIAQLAQAQVKRIVYVSCDPESFARDASVLADAGYRMSPVVPVDQFLWSSHIELAASFAARGKT